MDIAQVVSERGTCPRARVGAVIVGMDGRIVSSGYNGAPSGLPHCNEVGCEYVYKVVGQVPRLTASVTGYTSFNTGPPPPHHEQGCNNAVHAEENAIAYAARAGMVCRHAVLYCTHEPCLRCARLVISAGIEAVVYEEPYRLHEGIGLLKTAGVRVWRWNTDA